jgi:tRNA threonylcarbamoyladenosine biosynthesis protein TsaE
MASLNSVTRKINTLEDMEREAQSFIEALQPEIANATLVTLSGELGAGKTTFTQCVAKTLGVDNTVNSPTFVIEKIYGIPAENPEGLANRFTRLVHIDAYRLQSAGDLTMLGFGEVMNHAGTLVLLEWPEHVLGIGEQASVQILLELLPDGSRQITYA